MSLEDDIYRGDSEVPAPSVPIQVAESIVAPSSTTSSSGTFITGRLGALATVVEHAITRWARNRRRGSSASVSSQSSGSTSLRSFNSRPRLSRWRRGRTSSVNIRSTHSEREVAARLRVRHKIRRVDRGFNLYIPPNLSITTPQSPLPPQTTSLPVVLDLLEVVLKKASRSKKFKEKRRQHSLGVPPQPASFGDTSVLQSSVSGKETFHSKGICKQSESIPGSSQEFNWAPKAWWLDVASPTWDDLQTIGKLLHIHPLTLEDILQQDPREKMELFPKLGYYFISFRAIQSTAVVLPVHQQHPDDTDIYQTDDGALREANIYLVVFKEGICTFHFTDVSEHIEKVRNRVQLLQDNFNMSSDWIAHGILDSVVDSFFPFLKEIEQQVLSVESLVFSHDVPSSITLVDIKPVPTGDLGDCDLEKLPDIPHPSKESGESSPGRNSPIPRSCFTQPLFFQRLKRNLQNIWKTYMTSHEVKVKPAQATTMDTLLRMARARRLVTSLTRLLATKSEVVSQIRKRFLTGGRQTGFQRNEDVEIAIYMGDVQDHILTLQQSLHQYEHMLNDSHPAYLTQLRVNLVKAREHSDMFILLISMISIGTVCLQIPIGSFSLNVKLPKNSVNPPGPYNFFTMVLLILLGIGTVFIYTVRCWWIQAKRAQSKLYT